MRAMDIRERIKKIVQQQRETLQAEIEQYRLKLWDTEQVWGCGGAYNRQEKAIEKRERQLEELDDFERQLRHTAKHQEVTMYVFGCHKCGSVAMVNRQPFEDWHECPACRAMVYLPRLKSFTFQIVDTGEEWMKALKERAKEG